MKAVMYHYVRPFREELPFFRYLHLDDFRKQLDFLQKNYRFPSRSEFLASLECGAPAEGIVLTFDDGIKDHIQYVLPELLNRGLWGIFYVPTGMYATRQLLNVHRVHHLTGRYGSTRVLEMLGDFLKPEMFSQAYVDMFGTIPYRRQKNDEATTYLKRIFNYYLTDRWQTWVLDQLMAALEKEDELMQKYYLEEGEIRALQDDGMIIGSHSVSHHVMSKLDRETQYTEIRASYAFLENVTGGLDVRTFCYPYGGFHSFTAETEALLGDAGTHFSFNVEYRDVSVDDVTLRPQALPRYDCNKFPHGTVSLGARRPGV